MPSTTKITGRWPYPATTQQIQSVLLYCSLQQQWRRPTTCRNNRIFKRERGKKKQPESEKRQDKMALCKWEKTACATQHYRAMSLYNIKRKSVDSIKVAPRRNKTSSKKKKENNHKQNKIREKVKQKFACCPLSTVEFIGRCRGREWRNEDNGERNIDVC